MDQIQGELLIIGGAEDKKGDCEILRWLVERSKEREGNIVVITTATKSPEIVGREYRKVLERLGTQKIEVLNIDSRQDAYRQENVLKLAQAGVIFFTGGDQLRITSILGGTPVCATLYQVYQKGAVIAGTSAGAAIMSHTMIVEGEDDESPRRCTVKMAPGLGLLQEVVVDMHFSQRGRYGRLLTAIGQNPDILGIGIDEDTAIAVQDGRFKVLGSRSVLIVDGRRISYSNVSEQAPDEVLALTDVKLHILAKGYGYDLNQNTPMNVVNQSGSGKEGRETHEIIEPV